MSKIVNFYNSSTGTITSYDWDFGSGAIPSVASGIGPHAVSYDTTGLKTVTLIATGPDGIDTKTRINYIEVTPPPVIPPIANFAWSVNGGNALRIDFTDLSFYEPTAWVWTWGDGSTAGTTQSPYHTYTNYDSTYSVTLNASNYAGTDSTTINIVTGHYFYVDYSWGQLPEV